MEYRASIAVSVLRRTSSVGIESKLSQKALRLDCYLVGRVGRVQPVSSQLPATSKVDAAVDPYSGIGEHVRYLLEC